MKDSFGFIMNPYIPWKRYFARLIDSTLYFQLSFLFILQLLHIGMLPSAPNLIVIFIINTVVSIFIEYIFLVFWGTTLGKFLYNIQLKYNGKKLKEDMCIDRIKKLYLQGIWFGLPFLCIIPMYLQKKALRISRKTTYDEDLSIDITHKKITLLKAVLIGVVFFVLYASNELTGSALFG